MWNEVLGALTILAMVVFCSNASRIVEAVCDRIRYGAQTTIDGVEETSDDEPATVAEPTAKIPAAKPTETAPKPATTRAVA